MTCVIVNDASCLTDLRKGDLLGALCCMPYRIVVPLPIRLLEADDLTADHWRQLAENGAVIHDLTPQEIGRALLLKNRHPGLSANDCFCLVTAMRYTGVLLTGDNSLRRVASKMGVKVHGVLWVIDELTSSTQCNSSQLVHALNVWLEDDRVFLPENEIRKRLVCLERSGTVNGKLST